MYIAVTQYNIIFFYYIVYFCLMSCSRLLWWNGENSVIGIFIKEKWPQIYSWGRIVSSDLYRDVPKVFGHCNFLLYISCKTTIFENIIPKSMLGAQILNVHDLNTNLNYLSSNILSLYCIFDVQNLVLCLTRELI